MGTDPSVSNLYIDVRALIMPLLHAQSQGSGGVAGPDPAASNTLLRVLGRGHDGSLAVRSRSSSQPRRSHHLSDAQHQRHSLRRRAGQERQHLGRGLGGGKILKFDTHQNNWTEYQPLAYPNQTRRLNFDYEGNLWWGIWASGTSRPGKLAKMNTSTGKITEYTIPVRRRTRTTCARTWTGTSGSPTRRPWIEAR